MSSPDSAHLENWRKHFEAEIDSIRKTSRLDCECLLRTYGALSDACVSMLSRLEGYDPTGEQRDRFWNAISLFCTFIQGLPMVEDAILSGRFTQAAALQKQEIDALIGTKNLLSNKFKECRTPNAQKPFPSLKPLMKDLQPLAHLSVPVVWHEQGFSANNGEGTLALYPEYNPEIADLMLNNQMLILAHGFDSLVGMLSDEAGLEPKPSEIAAFRDACTQLM